MKNCVDSFKRFLHYRSIANVALDKLRGGIQVLGLAGFVNLRYQRIKYSDTMSALDKRVDEMRADKTRATRNQYVSF